MIRVDAVRFRWGRLAGWFRHWGFTPLCLCVLDTHYRP